MDRRHFLQGGTALVASAAGITAAAARPNAFILYVSARDCPYCLEWNAYDRANLERLCREAQVPLREVQVMRFSHIREDAAWPADLKPILAQFPYEDGTPRFIVVNNGRIIQHCLGREQYRRGILPMFV